MKKKLRDMFEGNKGKALEVSKKIGLKSANPFYKFYKEENREMDDLEHVIKLTEVVFGSKSEEELHNYLVSLHPNKQSIRSALEYAWMFKKNDLFEELLQKISTSTNLKSLEYEAFYRMQQNISKMSDIELLEKLEEQKASVDEMKAFSKLMLLSVYNRDAKFPKLEDEIPFAEASINKLSDGYMKRSFMTRLSSLKVASALNKGDVEETERLGIAALKENEISPLNIWINANIGNSHIMYDYNKAMKYFNDSIECCKLFNDQVTADIIQHSIDFCKAYWKVDTDPNKINVVGLSSMYNKVFAYIAVGENEEAMKLLETVDVDKLDFDNKAYHFFYKGLITNDKYDYYRSIDNFRETGDKHYSKLPLIELKKLGENEILLKALVVK